MEDTIFDYQPSRKNNKLEFINLYIYAKSKSINIKSLFELY